MKAAKVTASFLAGYGYKGEKFCFFDSDNGIPWGFGNTIEECLADVRRGEGNTGDFGSITDKGEVCEIEFSD